MAGKPLIAYTIEEVAKSKYIDKLVVTTDDEKIAQAARDYGAQVIQRPAELAEDKTPMNPRGRSKYGDNLGISVVRSLSVARELFARGVDVERVVVIGYGDSRPLKPEPDSKKPVNNRRAVIKYQPTSPESSTAP